jgi:hypothetical protein
MSIRCRIIVLSAANHCLLLNYSIYKESGVRSRILVSAANEHSLLNCVVCRESVFAVELRYSLSFSLFFLSFNHPRYFMYNFSIYITIYPYLLKNSYLKFEYLFRSTKCPFSEYHPKNLFKI